MVVYFSNKQYKGKNTYRLRNIVMMLFYDVF